MAFAMAAAWAAARDSAWTARSAPVTAMGRMAKGKEQMWALHAERYLRAYSGLPGQLVRYPPELNRLIGERIEAIAPALARAFDARLTGLAQSAWERWPVKTGLSRSLLDIEFDQRGDQFEGRVVSRAPYTVFIKTRAGSAYQELLRKPGRAVAAQIVADLARETG